MTKARLAARRSFRWKMLAGAAVLFSVSLLSGCGGGGGSTKVEMPENATPLPDDSMKVEIGHSATPKGRNIDAR